MGTGFDMSTYTFTKLQDPADPHDLTEITVTFEGITLEDMLLAYHDFLAGCGFQVQHQDLTYEERDNL